MREFVSLFALTTLAPRVNISSRLAWELIADDPDGPTKSVGLGLDTLLERIAEIGHDNVKQIYIGA